jgi:hypothetical protein
VRGRPVTKRDMTGEVAGDSPWSEAKSIFHSCHHGNDFSEYKRLLIEELRNLRQPPPKERDRDAPYQEVAELRMKTANILVDMHVKNAPMIFGAGRFFVGAVPKSWAARLKEGLVNCFKAQYQKAIDFVEDCRWDEVLY